MKTVLVKTHLNSGRPNMFKVIQDGNKEIERLTKSFGYSIVTTGKPGDYDSKDAWEEYTIIDDDGFTQWKNS